MTYVAPVFVGRAPRQHPSKSVRLGGRATTPQGGPELLATASVGAANLLTADLAVALEEPAQLACHTDPLEALLNRSASGLRPQRVGRT